MAERHQRNADHRCHILAWWYAGSLYLRLSGPHKIPIIVLTYDLCEALGWKRKSSFSSPLIYINICIYLSPMKASVEQ